MFKSIFAILPLLSALSTLVSADVTPTSPDGNTVFKVGQTAEAMWSKDTQGNWTDVTVKLMTGDNFNMVEVTTLAENIDGTTATSLDWTVPDVTPNSKIYFLQFTPANSTGSYQWTTRFTIAAADGSTTEPSNPTQPGTGAAIPWGTGMLVSGGNSTTPATSSNSTTAVTSSSSSSTMASSSTMESSSSSQVTMTTSVRAAAATSDSASSAGSSVSRSASAASASATTTTSGATSVQVAGGLVAVVGFMAGFMVL